jgi:hypothetical protein
MIFSFVLVNSQKYAGSVYQVDINFSESLAWRLSITLGMETLMNNKIEQINAWIVKTT